MPSPAAGALIAGFVWLAVDKRLPINAAYFNWVAFAFTVYAGVTMVSNAPFWSGKAIAIKQSVPFWALGLVALGFVAVSSDPPVVLFGLFVLYGVSGYALWAWRWISALKANATSK